MGLIVDEFAGGGGASTGLEWALGRPVDVAVNHSETAISVHTANHPHTRHLTANVWQVDPVKATGGQPVDVAWFSPDCKHFSKAKGGRPVDKNIRGLAWVVLRWAGMPAALRPKIIFLENVEEFQTWGPLDRAGRPIKSLKGRTFLVWLTHLRALGYTVEWRVLKACDFGAPTIRKRLFVVARRDGRPIRWPEPSHYDPRAVAELDPPAPGMVPWRTAADCIDWSIHCPSIFERKRPLADATMRRIALGIKRYALDAADPFIVSVAHGYSGGRREYSIHEPLGTPTAGGICHAVVAPSLVGVGGRMGQSSPRPVDAPYHTNTAKADTGLVVPTLIQTGYGERAGQAPRVPGLDKPLGTIVTGGKHALVAAFLAQHNTGVVGHDAREPISTITGRGTQQAVVASHMINLKGASRRMSPVDAPVPAVTAGGWHIGEVRAFLIKYFGTAIGAALDQPLHTSTAKDRFGLVTVEIGGEPYVIADIGMRMLTPRELFRAQGFPDDYIIDRGADGEPINKSQQVMLCGNSVCPQVARAVAEANIEGLVFFPETEDRIPMVGAAQ